MRILCFIARAYALRYVVSARVRAKPSLRIRTKMSSALFFRSICEYNSHTSLSRGGIDFGYRAIKIYDLLYRNFTPTFVITENPNKIKGV